jgi:hypothetical protein
LTPAGKFLWQYQPRETVQFGADVYAPPYTVDFFHVSEMGQGKPKIIWVVSHQIPWYPTVVAKLDEQGNVLSQFWHSGHVTMLSEAMISGRRVILAGGTHNAVYRAALAVLDFNEPAGRSPSPSDAYLCRSCPMADPLAFILFPRSEVSTALDTREITAQVILRETGLIEIAIHAGAPGAGAGAGEIYEFDSGLSLRNAEIADGYNLAHAELRKHGFLKRPFNRRATINDLLSRIEYWDGTSFAPLRPSQSPFLRASRPAVENPHGTVQARNSSRH